MDSPPTLDVFHARLDQLLALVWPYLDELEAIATRDDAIMQLWLTEPVLSEEQKRQREEFQAWAAMDGLAFDDPEVGAESCIACAWWRNHSYLRIQEAIRRCREAAGYGEPSVILHRALKFLDQSLRDCTFALRSRLHTPWPRSRIEDALAHVSSNSFLLSERRLRELVDENEERELREQEEWKTAKSASQSNTVWQSIYGIPLGDVAMDLECVSFYVEFPAELADKIARDLLFFDSLTASEIQEHWMSWYVSPLTQPIEFYRLLSSLLPECPTNFLAFGSILPALQSDDYAAVRDALQKATTELQLFGSWLQVTGLWSKRPIEPQASSKSISPENLELDSTSAPKPQWLADERSLSYTGKIVRQFAPNIRKDVLDIVNSFQECEWKTRIDDPLSPPDADKTKLALRTINKGLKELKFSKDGDGIKWKVILK